jgi:hypothetical protein
MKAFDPTKPVQTRDGRPARILCTDKRGNGYPILALITEDSGEEFACSFTVNGHNCSDGLDGLELPCDLVNVPEKREGWINVYPVPESPWRTPSSWLYPTMEEAIEACAEGCLATIKVEWQE